MKESLVNRKSILETKDLSIGYKDGRNATIIANAINFSIKNGELVGLVGANGVGKSTLIRTISGLQKSLKGEILLKESNFNNYDSLQSAQLLSIVLTESLPSKNLSVFELVALGRHPYTNWIGKLNSIDLQKTVDAIEQTGISALKDQKCYKLSDGQLQKAMIARALAQDTELIVLDEPTTHLDLFHKVSILKLLKNIAHTSGKAVFFSSHEIDLALQVCDKIVVMKSGNTFFETPDNLIKNGVFNDLFPKGMLEFDSLAGNFKIITK